MINMLSILKVSRPISWVNTAYPFAVGYLLVFQQIDWRLLLGSFFFLIPYNLLMYGINDVFDYESDLKNPRKGGVEGAVLDKSFHRSLLIAAIGLAGPFMIILLFTGLPTAKLWLLYLIFMVVAYSAPHLRFKERPVLDSFTSATHFVSPLVYALLLHGWQFTYWPYVIAFFLWGMASHAFGAVQDIKADRQGRINSIGTIFGARLTTWLSGAAYIASAILTLSVSYGQIIAPAILLYALNISPYLRLRDQDCEQAHAGWQRFLYLNYLVGAIITIVIIYALHAAH